MRLFAERLRWLKAAQRQGREDLVERIKALLRKDIKALPKRNAIVLDARGQIEKTESDEMSEKVERSVHTEYPELCLWCEREGLPDCWEVVSKGRPKIRN